MFSVFCVTVRVIPLIDAVAFSSQYGAPSPVNAGTRYVRSTGFASLASPSVSFAEEIRFIFQPPCIDEALAEIRLRQPRFL